MGYRVLILCEHYSGNDGSSVALRGYLKDNKDISYYKVLCRTVKFNDINIREVHGWQDIRDELEKSHYDVIHYFRLLGYELFKWTIKSINNLNISIKIITTVNQRPSFVGTLLSPNEIRYSDKIVFIDTTAYNDALLSYIPQERKERIYYCTSQFDEIYNRLYDERKVRLNNKDKVVFGRGSTINKCPPDMIENFQKIDFKDKEFRIVGIPDGSWVKAESCKYENVTTYPLLAMNDWLNVLKEFDVFLYQIPENAYSSLDGTLGAAMNLGIPVVYYGSEAPKERFINGENGFVAVNKVQLVEYCTKLAHDKELRNKIGEAGRESTLRQFNWRNTVNGYNRLYGAKKEEKKIKVPIIYYVYFFKTSFKLYYREQFKDTAIESAYRTIKSLFN